MFAGIETGTISYYKLSDDLNVLESIQTFNAHSSAAVVQCYFCPLRNWILSIGAEGSFVWSELNGNKLGNYILPSKPRCFQVSLYVSSETLRPWTFLVWLWVWIYILWRWFWACYYPSTSPRIQNWSSYYVGKSSRTNQLLVLGQLSTKALLLFNKRKSSHFVGYWGQTGSFYRIKRSFKTSPNDIHSSKLVIYHWFRGKLNQMGFDQKTKEMCRMDRIRFLSGKKFYINRAGNFSRNF